MLARSLTTLAHPLLSLPPLAPSSRPQYLAVIAGVPQETTVVTERIGRHPTDRVRMAVVQAPRGDPPDAGSAGVARGGRASLSVVHRLATDGKLSLVAVRIGTGRTHQIRVHLEHLRCPVLGDPLYGDASRNKLEAKRATRPLLHAHLLQLAHPITDAPLRVCAPPPEDISAVAATLAGCEPEQLATWLQP